MDAYCVAWSPAGIMSAEAQLQRVHQSVKAFLSSCKGSGGSIEPCGSFLLRTNVHYSPYAAVQSDNGLGMDVCVTMPEAACSLDDVQDGHYLVRREAFLGMLKAFLEKDLAAPMQPAASNKTKKSQQQSVRTAPSYTVALRLVPFHHDITKHFLRVVFMHEEGDTACESEGCSEPSHPARTTRQPFHVDVHVKPAAVGARIAAEKAVEKHTAYSQLVLEDFLMPAHLKRFHDACLKSQNLAKVIVFIKAWAAHNGIVGSTCPHGLNGYQLTAMILKLAEDGILTPNLSDENMIRAVWVQLARNAFVAPSSSVPSLKFAGETFNCLYRTSSSFISIVLRECAEEALRLKTASDAFYCRHVPLELRFDVSLTLSGLETITSNPKTLKSSNEKQGALAREAERVGGIVTTALGSRKLKDLLLWFDGCGNGTLLLNVPTEGGDARSRLSVGPAIEDTDGVSAFDAFWGADVTSTRQFPDGSIHRCVAWAGLGGGLPSLGFIFQHILQRALVRHVVTTAHVGVLLGGLETFVYERVGNEFLDAVPLTESSVRSATTFVTDLFGSLPQASLPCKITSFDVISPSARGCEPFAARAHIVLTKTTDSAYPALAVCPSIEPIHCVLSIDDKHKIPDTIEAIGMMKGAICAQLSKSIQAAHGETVRTLCTSHSVDVIYSGFLFRVYVAHFREVSLLRALQKDAEAAFLERKLFWTARHTKFLSTLAFGHPSFGLAVRLARRWVAAMFLGEFFAPELIELLVADAYLSDKPPRSAQRGFVNFLQLVAGHDWRRTPLVLAGVAESEIVDSQRPPECAMWVLTPYAPTQSPFTIATPRQMVLHRLVSLAKSAVRTISVLLNGSSGTSLHRMLEASIFAIDETEFDAMLSLAPAVQLQPDRNIAVHPHDATSVVRRFWQQDELLDSDFKRYVAQLIELEPAMQSIKAVRARTRDRCMVFTDSLGPSKMAAVLLSSSPSVEQVSQLHNDIQSMVRGVVQPATPAAASASSSKVGKSSGGKSAAQQQAGSRKRARKDDADTSALEVAPASKPHSKKTINKK